MENKTKQIHFRVSSSRFEEIAKRAKAFQGITHFINSAIDEFSDDTYKLKRDVRRQLIDFYRVANMHLGHIGGNLNQTVHHLNELARIGTANSSYLINEVYPHVQTLHRLCLEIQQQLRIINNQTLKR